MIIKNKKHFLQIHCNLTLNNPIIQVCQSLWCFIENVFFLLFIHIIILFKYLLKKNFVRHTFSRTYGCMIFIAAGRDFLRLTYRGGCFFTALHLWGIYQGNIFLHRTWCYCYSIVLRLSPWLPLITQYKKSIGKFLLEFFSRYLISDIFKCVTHNLRLSKISFSDRYIYLGFCLWNIEIT